MTPAVGGLRADTVEQGGSRRQSGGPGLDQVTVEETVRAVPAQLTRWVYDHQCQPHASHAQWCTHGQASALHCSLTGPLPAGPLCLDALGTSQNNRCTTDLFITPQHLPSQLASSWLMAISPSSCPGLNLQSPPAPILISGTSCPVNQ